MPSGPLLNAWGDDSEYLEREVTRTELLRSCQLATYMVLLTITITYIAKAFLKQNITGMYFFLMQKATFEMLCFSFKFNLRLGIESIIFIRFLAMQF